MLYNELPKKCTFSRPAIDIVVHLDQASRIKLLWALRDGSYLKCSLELNVSHDNRLGVIQVSYTV